MSLPLPDLPPPAPPPTADPGQVATPEEVAAALAPPVPVEKKAEEEDDEPTFPPSSIPGMLVDAVTFPWLSRNLSILIPGAIMLLLLAIGTIAPVIGIIPAILGPLYFAAYYFKIVEAAITQRKDLPEWPAVSNFVEDLLIPGLQMVAIWFIGALPALLWNMTHGMGFGAALSADGPVVLRLLGNVYFPIGVLSVVVNGSLLPAVQPKILLTLIKLMPNYLILAVAMVMVELPLRFLTGIGLVGFFFGVLLGPLVTMACLIMHARLTGTFYHYHQAKIGW